MLPLDPLLISSRSYNMGLLLRGTTLTRTYEVDTKTHIFRYFYYPCLVLFTTVLSPVIIALKGGRLELRAGSYEALVE